MFHSHAHWVSYLQARQEGVEFTAAFGDTTQQRVSVCQQVWVRLVNRLVNRLVKPNPQKVWDQSPRQSSHKSSCQPRTPTKCEIVSSNRNPWSGYIRAPFSLPRNAITCSITCSMKYYPARNLPYLVLFTIFVCKLFGTPLWLGCKLRWSNVCTWIYSRYRLLRIATAVQIQVELAESQRISTMHLPLCTTTNGKHMLYIGTFQCFLHFF